MYNIITYEHLSLLKKNISFYTGQVQARVTLTSEF